MTKPLTTIHNLPVTVDGDRDAGRGETIPPRRDLGRCRDYTPTQTARFAVAVLIGLVAGWPIIAAVIAALMLLGIIP